MIAPSRHGLLLLSAHVLCALLVSAAAIAAQGRVLVVATERAGSDELDGRFLVEIADCQIVETGKAIEWPPHPLTVVGNF